MADKAALLGQTLLDLLRGVRPTLPPSSWETNYVVGAVSESPNKQAVSNADQLLWSYEREEWSTCNAILDWVVGLEAQPFMPKECLTGEELYRALTALPCLVFAGIALKMGRDDAYVAALKLARAHVSWALLGLGPVPGREVLDHHLEAVSEPCVLIGRGKAKFPIRRVAQAGKRGWVRNRDAGAKKFQFIEHLAHSVMVYQALRWDIPRKVRKACEWPVETFNAITNRFPILPTWGFGPDEILDLSEFANDPADWRNVQPLIPHLKATSLPVQFTRYEDGSVVSVLLRGDSSSTDSLMLDACYANGEVRLTSSDDGLRPKAVRQVAWEESAAFACRPESGSGPTMRIPKPLSEAMYSVVSQNGWTRLLSADPVDMDEIPPLTPPGATPPPVDPHHCSWLDRILGRCR